MLIANAAADQFLRNPLEKSSFFLVHGSDEGLVRERAGKIVKAALGDNPDPMRLTRFDGDALAREPGALIDETQAITMFGGDRVIWIEAQVRDILPALEPVFATPTRGFVLIVEAGVLKKGAPLRVAFEALAGGVAIECYPDNRERIGALIDEEARDAGLRIPPEVRSALCDVLGADRMTTRGEIAKLVLYARGRDTVTAADVQAIVSDAAPSMLDEAIDAAFLGDGRAADEAAHFFFADGGDPSALLSAAVRHAVLLHRLRAELDSGRGFDIAVQSAHVRIFFTRKAALRRQADRWPSAKLDRLLPSLRTVAARLRQDLSLAEAAALRACWAIASSARSGRSSG